MSKEIYNRSASIVIRGPFAPTIFQPIWFSQHNLIKTAEAENADIQIITATTSAFTADWLQINVLPDRFQARTNQEAYFEVLRDLVDGVLGIIKGAPYISMGLNWDYNFQLESVEEWHQVGHRLAPKGDWEDLLSTPGMRQLKMQGVRTDEYKGYLLVSITPSENLKNGLFIEVNDHYNIQSSDDVVAPTNLARKIIMENWTESMRSSETISKKIASLGEPNG